MTLLGKLFTLLNLAAAVALLAWGTAVYTNRTDWLNTPLYDPATGLPDGAEAGQISKLSAEITQQLNAIGSTDEGYGVRVRALAQTEARRDHRRLAFEALLAKAKTPAAGAENDPAFFALDDEAGNTGLTDVDKPGPKPVDGPDGKPLRALSVIQADLEAEVKKAEAVTRDREWPGRNGWAELDKIVGTPDFDQFRDTLGLVGLRRLQVELSDRVNASEGHIDRQQVALANLGDEAEFLKAGKINWVAELQTLERRKRQLEARLKQLGGN